MLELGPTTFLQIINFVVLLVLLRFLLWKPLMEALQNRKNHIETKIQEAEAINNEAKTLRDRYEAQIAQAKSEAQALMNDASADAEKMRERLISEAKADAARILKQGERDAVLEKEKAMTEVKHHFADLTVATAAKVLKDTLDPATQEKLMADIVRKVGAHVN